MATYEDTLTTVLTRRDLPVQSLKREMTGVDIWDIFAGMDAEVPNVFELINAKVRVTTDATVANRNLQLNIIAGGNITVIGAQAANLAASSTENYHYGFITDNTNFNGSQNGGIGTHCYIIAGSREMDYLRIQLGTGKAGDTLDIRVRFRWLNWDLGMELPAYRTHGLPVIPAGGYNRRIVY